MEIKTNGNVGYVELKEKMHSLGEMTGVISIDMYGLLKPLFVVNIDEDLVDKPLLLETLATYSKEHENIPHAVEIVGYKKVTVENLIKEKMEDFEGVIGCRVSYEGKDKKNGLDIYKVWVGADVEGINLDKFKELIQTLIKGLTVKINLKVSLAQYKHIKP